MGVVSCAAAPTSTKRHPMQFRITGANTKTRSQIRGAKLPIIPVITLWTLLQCGMIVEVAAQTQALTPTEAPMVGGPSPLSPPPFTPPPPALGQVAQFQQVLSYLRAKNYTVGAQYLSDYLFLLPVGSTIFVPTNTAFNGFNRNQAQLVGPILAYHAILQQLNYEQILLLPVGTRFPSLLDNDTVVLTSVAPDDLRVDDVSIVQGDICTSSSNTSALLISCHGVDGILNMTLWGHAVGLSPVPSPEAQPPPPELAPPSVVPPIEEGPAPAPAPTSPPSGAPARDMASRSTLLLVVFLCVFAAIVIV
ncbi:unnamed protein product [Calypogeia fissa]